MKRESLASFLKNGIQSYYVKPNDRRFFAALRVYAERNHGSMSEFVEILFKLYIKDMTDTQKEHYKRALESVNELTGDSRLIDKAIGG